IAAIGPIEDAVFQIELEVDRLRQLVEQHLDVGAVRWALALRDIDVGAAEKAPSAFGWAFLRPVDFAKLRIDGDSDAVPRLIAPVLIAAAGLDQRFDLRAVEVRAHHAHALAVAPVELAAFLLEVHLFRRVGAAWRHDDLAVPAVEVSALDRAVIEAGDAHVGPVDMPRRHIHGDAVGETAIGDDGLAVGAVGIHRVNAVAAQFKNEQPGGTGRTRGSLCSRGLDYGHGFTLLGLDFN